MSSKMKYVDSSIANESPEFDATLLNQKFFRMTILGATYSGKSTFIKYIFPSIKKKYSQIYVFTPSFNADFYDDFIYDVIDKKTGEKIVVTQKYFTSDFDEAISMCTLIRDNNKDLGDTILIILDDIISNKATKNDEFLKLFASSRHSNISLIYCIQFITHEYANNSLRANSNVIVTTRPSQIQTRNWLKKNLIQEPLMKKHFEDNDEQIKNKIDKVYNYIFKDKYDKLVVYEDKIFKTTGY